MNNLTAINHLSPRSAPLPADNCVIAPQRGRDKVMFSTRAPVIGVGDAGKCMQMRKGRLFFNQFIGLDWILYFNFGVYGLSDEDIIG